MSFDTLCVLIKNPDTDRVEQHYFYNCNVTINAKEISIEWYEDSHEESLRFLYADIISVSGIVV